ncbi:ATPase components of ABC transporters with duplicated ATPase domains [Microlunatus sagamiharensis]|uniref:ATPase components of ABC transporters with duplicated ATPase domains n=1 Tax=Microlunatus sagamiharensis TaxID=546874 RepID=A0A1H2MWF1_9ACTN|nr:ABC-F family ATP-binding cassette domain-containing protein [Microlunatus sagamiharensis]SDU96896.1 ATPase components of ABC transporters with duplicated ATPase domains [Microlunatus sagamiharensis]
MSATLVARDLSAGHGARVLFSGLDLTVAPGDVTGLVGANGAGKSTLLGLLAGLGRPEAGTIALSPPSATVGLLPQEPERRGDEDVTAYVARRTGVADAQRDLDAATEALSREDAGSDDWYAVAFDRWLALGGADLEERTAEQAADLGLTVPLDAAMTSLSGGEAARVGLLALLLSRFDVLLLDEPTNDLDLDGLDRLERFVQTLRVGAVVVSHDREFLRRCVTTVVELDLAQQKVEVFGGGYEAYLHEREVRRQHAREAYEEYSETRADLTQRMRAQRAWAVQGVTKEKKNPKDNDKAQRDFRINRTEKQASKVRATERLIERLDEVEEPRKEWQLQMEIAAAPRSGSVVATLNRAVVHRGTFTLGPVDLTLSYGDRVAVLGPNGAGKTTLIRLLLGRTAPDEGLASLGASVRVGEVDQARDLVDGPDLLVDVMERELPDLSPADVRTLLAKFGLRADHVRRAASSLSPGERTRAALALLQSRGTNLLVLDEPTNHLDLPAIEQLESALASYAGTLVLVSHDRRMLEAVHVTRRLHVERGVVEERPV